MWQRWLDIPGMYLHLGHLYKLKSPYDSINIYVGSGWNNAYDKWDNLKRIHSWHIKFKISKSKLNPSLWHLEAQNGPLRPLRIKTTNHLKAWIGYEVHTLLCSNLRKISGTPTGTVGVSKLQNHTMFSNLKTIQKVISTHLHPTWTMTNYTREKC